MGNLLNSWKTSALGLVILAAVAWRVYHDPASATSAETIAAIASAFGLVMAKDAAKTGTVEAPRGEQ